MPSVETDPFRHGDRTSIEVQRPPCEWIETDGRGGYALGTSDLIPSRKYHSLLSAADPHCAHRYTLLAGVDVSVKIFQRYYPLSSFAFHEGWIHPDGARRISHFTTVPWPKWSYDVTPQVTVDFELLLSRDPQALFLVWTMREPKRVGASLIVRPLLAGRDHHGPLRVQGGPGVAEEGAPPWMQWRFPAPAPSLWVLTSGEFEHHAVEYHDLHYAEEVARGYPGTECLFSPGVFLSELNSSQAVIVISPNEPLASEWAIPLWHSALRSESARRLSVGSARALAAQHYTIRTSGGPNIIAGYPWFSCWGRDSCIAARGFLLAQQRFSEAEQLLSTLGDSFRGGLLPNVFGAHGNDSSYNSIDAPLWFLYVASELLAALKRRQKERFRAKLRDWLSHVIAHFIQGTEFGIAVDSEDGLLRAGEAGAALTWMDAVTDVDGPVTPRAGKPVEIQALWIHALASARALLDEAYGGLYDQARASFRRKFWCREKGYLYDVVDADHVTNRHDSALRPNQLFALGALRLQLVDRPKCLSALSRIEQELVTPRGLRTLSPGDPRYRGRYEGPVEERDRAYHQGTVWPWLFGPFVDAWLAHRRDTKQAAAEAEERFLAPLTALGYESGSAHIPEIADGDPPHEWRGCPFQAWSLSELMRIEAVIAAKK